MEKKKFPSLPFTFFILSQEEIQARLQLLKEEREKYLESRKSRARKNLYLVGCPGGGFLFLLHPTPVLLVCFEAGSCILGLRSGLLLELGDSQAWVYLLAFRNRLRRGDSIAAPLQGGTELQERREPTDVLAGSFSS